MIRVTSTPEFFTGFMQAGRTFAPLIVLTGISPDVKFHKCSMNLQGSIDFYFLERHEMQLAEKGKLDFAEACAKAKDVEVTLKQAVEEFIHEMAPQLGYVLKEEDDRQSDTGEKSKGLVGSTEEGQKPEESKITHNAL